MCEGHRHLKMVYSGVQPIPGGTYYEKVAASDIQVDTGQPTRHIPTVLHE